MQPPEPSTAGERSERKLSKADAAYVAVATGRRRCSQCSMFRPPHGCTLVGGNISPAGHCRYWASKQGSAKWA